MEWIGLKWKRTRMIKQIKVFCRLYIGAGKAKITLYSILCNFYCAPTVQFSGMQQFYCGTDHTVVQFLVILLNSKLYPETVAVKICAFV